MLSYKKINKIIKIKFFNLYIYVYMSDKDLYYEKYLKYKNKYLNLQSQVGGTTIDAKYFDDLIEYLNYTKRIFHYLDKFYMLTEAELITNMPIKFILKDLIYSLKQTLIRYTGHLNKIHTIIETSKNVLNDVPLASVGSKLVPLETINDLKPLDNIQPTNQYYEDYLKILEGVDFTKELINSLLTQTGNLTAFLETLDKIIINIELLIKYLIKEEKIDKDRTNIQKKQRKEYLSLEEKEKEERIKNQLAIKQEFTDWKKRKENDELESHEFSDYGRNN